MTWLQLYALLSPVIGLVLACTFGFFVNRQNKKGAARLAESKPDTGTHH